MISHVSIFLYIYIIYVIIYLCDCVLQWEFDYKFLTFTFLMSQAEGVYNARLQNMALTIDKVTASFVISFFIVCC